MSSNKYSAQKILQESFNPVDDFFYPTSSKDDIMLSNALEKSTIRMKPGLLCSKAYWKMP